MEPTNSLMPYIRLTAALLDPAEGARLARSQIPDSDPAIQWQESPLNPLNRPDTFSYSASGHVAWRVDGCASRGRRFFAVPSFGGTSLGTLNAMDVYVPDPVTYPAALRVNLDTDEAFWCEGSPTRRLAICQFLGTALSHWSNQVPNFQAVYKAMPLGSRIVVENMASNYWQMKIRFSPVLGLHERLLTAEQIGCRWQIPTNDLPPPVDLGDLNLVSRIHESVSIVTAAETGDTPWALKNRLSNPETLYQELHVVLTTARHPNIIAPPHYLVTTPEGKVYGFLSAFHPLGTLSRLLSSGSPPDIPASYRLSLQLTSALSNILSQPEPPPRFYPNLKPDNVICTGPSTIALLDLEHTGTWKSFTAPEVSHLENLLWISESPHVPASSRQACRARLLEHLHLNAHSQHVNPPGAPVWHDGIGNSSSNCNCSNNNLTNTGNSNTSEDGTDQVKPQVEWHHIWTSLPRARREAAMVYALGKMLWCIFEGQSHTRNGIDEAYPFYARCAWEFPEFRRAPGRVRSLVRACTSGDVVWWDRDRDGDGEEEEGNGDGDGDGDGKAASGRRRRRWRGLSGSLVRVGTKVYPRGREGQKVTAEETVRFAHEMAKREVRQMWEYLDVLRAWERGSGAGVSDAQKEMLGFPKRPSLAQVREIMERGEEEEAAARIG